MSRIVFDARELRTSSGRYVERLLHYLQALDRENDYRVLLKPADMDWRPSSPNFHTVACPHKEFTFDEQFGLKEQIEGLKPDLVHFTFAQQPIWYRGKVVTTFHDLTTMRFNNPDKNPLVFKLKQQVYKFVVKQAAKKSAVILAPSQFVKNDVAEFTGVDPAKITVTYEAADKIPDKPEPVIEVIDKSFIMYLGRPTPHKNLERLIQAFAVLNSNHPDLWLVLGGQTDANYRELEKLVQANGIKNVVFTGLLSEGQLRWSYEHCAAYVFPSLSEGFGLPGLEAMLHGAPVVASRATCLPEVYGDAARYFDPLSSQAMADAINEVLTDKNLRIELIKKGAEQVKKYSWERLAKQTLEVYQKALL